MGRQWIEVFFQFDATSSTDFNLQFTPFAVDGPAQHMLNNDLKLTGQECFADDIGPAISW